MPIALIRAKIGSQAMKTSMKIKITLWLIYGKICGAFLKKLAKSNSIMFCGLTEAKKH